MTKQMKKSLFVMMMIVACGFFSFAVMFFINGIGYTSFIGYIGLSFSFISFVSIGVVLLIERKKEKEFLKMLELAKSIVKQRNQIIYKFYVENGIPFMYDKNGNLRDVDSLLGIKKEFDKEGRLMPTIYELLKVSPLFDKSGKEIPLVLVIKHFIKNIKMKDIDKLGFTSYVFTRKTDDESVKAEHETSNKLKKVANLMGKSDNKSSSSKGGKIPGAKVGSVLNVFTAKPKPKGDDKSKANNSGSGKSKEPNSTNVVQQGKQQVVKQEEQQVVKENSKVEVEQNNPTENVNEHSSEQTNEIKDDASQQTVNDWE